MNIDKFIILLLPVLATVLLPFLDGIVLSTSLLLILVLFIYECFIYKYRYLYGFSGILILSIPSVVMVTFTIFLAIPSIYICSIKNHASIYPYFFSVISFYLIYPIGLLVGNATYKVDQNRLIGLRSQDYSKDNINSLVYEGLILLFIIIGIIIFIYFLRVERIPLLEIIRNPGDYIRLNLLREQALKMLPVTFIERYLFGWVQHLFLPIGISASLYLFFVYRKYKMFVLFLIYFITGVVFNSITLEKSPVAAIFLSIAAFFFLKQKKVKISLIIVSIIIVLFAPMIIIFFLQYGKENIWEVIMLSLFTRIFIVPTEALYNYFLIFPETHDFLYGRSTQLFSWLHSGGNFNAANFMAKLMWNDPDTTGSLNANYIGNSWADFGTVGVIISTFLVGFILHHFYRLLLTISQYKKDIVYVMTICGTLSMFTFAFFSSNITILFFSEGLILLVFLFVFFKQIINKLTA